MGLAASNESTPLSRHERSRLSRQALLTTPSQRSALLLFVVATILSCSTSVGLYDTLTSACPLPLVALARLSPPLQLVATSEYRRSCGLAAAPNCCGWHSWRGVLRCATGCVLQQQLEHFILMAIVAIIFNPGSVEQCLAEATSFSHAACSLHAARWLLSLGTQMEMLATLVLYDGRGQSHPKVLEHHSMSLFCVVHMHVHVCVSLLCCRVCECVPCLSVCSLRE